MKAVGLFSGGLDSTLAIKVILEQGIEIVALNFMSPFCRCQRGEGCGSVIDQRAKELGASFRSMYLGDEYLEIVRNPKHGYGKNLNPCIDCRILKLKKAKAFMQEIGASFIITGEVLGQRPMSQHRQALNLIEKESGLEGLILRPLSAKLFAPTLAENKGWVNREALLEISGRTRKPQIKLAAQLGIKDYPCPAGGCLLTDSGFSKRLNDLIKYDIFTIKDIEFLKTGRYFRINPYFSLTVGRDEKENDRLVNICSKEDVVFEPLTEPGPVAIGRGRLDSEAKDICAKIVARYTTKDKKIKVKIKIPADKEECLAAEAIEERELGKLRIN
ncbi:MAG: hypothetical protein K9L86_04360 [Candidatus Omnitrophica bacterium]|nr:hypothetical protein [Candidatus Omnitrophota bacterium]